MTAFDALIEHWRCYAPEGDNFLHHRDAPFLAGARPTVHSNVQAYPYAGDLRAADIWLLMLNSKLGPDDVAEEATEPYQSLFRKNLMQELTDEEFPLLSLHPALRQTGTYQYYNYERGLAALIQEYGRIADLSELDARRMCSRRLAILELLPYRSANFPADLMNLPSVNLARRAAREASATKLLIVPWGLGRWGLTTSNNVLNRSARGFTFAPHGKAGYGQAILARLASPA